jgi:predicted esterase
MQTHHVSIQKTVRYVTIGKPTEKVEHLWISIHGYGQLPAYFGKRFEKYASKERLFVFPEGPHRFNINGTSGRVGASWMTKEDRINDIEDQFNYLEALVSELRADLSAACKIHVLGFSQGVATAFRWMDKSALTFSSLIAWAGTFPPDIDYALHQEQFNHLKTHACFGDGDEFISTENAQKLVSQLAEQGITFTPHFYHGGHKLYLDLLDALIRDCESL